MEVDAMALRRLRWRQVATLTIACCFGAAALGHAQFTSVSDRSRSLLEGNWQSCRESDGHYAERVYDGKWPGMGPFNVELVGRRARQTWETAGLRLDVSLAGGSREDCESWYVTVQRSSAASH
jgi:hypothetical protein